MNWDVVLRFLRVGAQATVYLSVATLALSTVLALPIAVLSLSPVRIVRKSIALYTTVFRGTPELVILFFTFLVLPQLGLRLKPMTAAILAFTMFSTAYIVEIFRGGFQGVQRGQFEAARGLGLSYPRTIRRIILPQVLRIVVAPFMSNATIVVKRSSLASAVAVNEIMSNANLMIVSTNRPFLIIALVGLIYVILNSAILGMQVVFEKRWAFKF